MRYKLIAADFDDTILHDDHTISQAFVDAVRAYEKIGGKFIIATGRMTSAIIYMVRELGFKGEILTFQGSIITDIESGNMLDTTTIPYNKAAEISKYLYDKGVYHHIYKDGYVLSHTRSEYNERYARLSNSELIVLKEPLHEYLENNKHCPVKILIMEKPEFVAGHIKEITQEFGQFVNVNTSKKWVVEIISKNINKGIAVDKIAKKYGIKQEEVICIGDSMNDIPMIEYAGLGVVVANGSKEALEVADIIAPSNNDDGVAYIIRKYGIGE